MPVEVKVPALSESVASATLLTWQKREGDRVARDETLVAIETDKVILDLPAPAAGVLTRILRPDGETVGAGEVVALIEPDAEGVAPAPAEAGTEASPPAAGAASASTEVTPPAAEAAPARAEVTAPVGAHSAMTGGRPERRVPMTRLRTLIAERLTAAQNSMATLTTFNEINMQAIADLRQRHGRAFEQAHGVRLGLMSFFIRAVAAALKRFPVINASIDGNDIVYHGYYDIGVAVSAERGLVVPVIRDADQLSCAGLEKAVAEYARQARDGSLSAEALTGGTFTLTNGGVFGSLLSTPVINPPQAAILGMHRIQDRPVVEAGHIVARPMMYVALSYDHRLIDGRDAVLFLAAVKDALEDPARLLLEV